MAEADTMEVPDRTSFGTDYLPQNPTPAPAPLAPAVSDAPGGILGDISERGEQAGASLLDATRQKFRTESFVDQQATGRMEQDRAQMKRAFDAAGAAKDSIPPQWDADQERNARIRGPMEQFGSIGSVFAMMASAFTRTPMTSALKAGAAAMEAIQKSDEKGYESAYAAWKDNTSLALKRFEAERSMFTDADKLMSTDMNAWRAKRLAIASQFEDRKKIIMLENGMDKEVLEAEQAQIKGALDLTNAKKAMEDFEIDRQIYRDGVKAFRAANPDATPQQDVQFRLQLTHDVKSGARSWQQEALRNFQLTNPNATPEQTQAFMQSLRGGQGGSNANPNLTTDRQRAGDIAEARKKWKAEGLSDAEIARKAAEMEKELKGAAAPFSAKNKEMLQKHIDQFGVADRTLDKTISVLNRYIGAAGIAGKANRLAERVGNLFTTNNTDRTQFMRDIELLRAQGPQLLLDRSGRPLSAEAAHINDIIAGLSAGDTTANTLRSLREIKQLYAKMRDEAVTRLEGKWEAPGTGVQQRSPSPGGDWWKNLPDKRQQAQ